MRGVERGRIATKKMMEPYEEGGEGIIRRRVEDEEEDGEGHG